MSDTLITVMNKYRASGTSAAISVTELREVLPDLMAARHYNGVKGALYTVTASLLCTYQQTDKLKVAVL